MSVARKRKAAHVVMDVTAPSRPDGAQRVGTCTHCGEHLVLALPLRVEVFSAALTAFVKAHKTCALPAPPSDQPTGETE